MENCKHLKTLLALLLALLFVLMPQLAAPQTAEAATAIVSTADKKYTYSDLKTDIQQLAKRYPDRLTVQKLGSTADGRFLYALVLGNPEAEKQIFVTAGMHAREYINCQVTMKMVEYYCQNYTTGKYKGQTYERLFDRVSICVMPMVNPDGIAISALGTSAIRDKALRTKVKKMPRSGAYSNWQANARGVDLNRNYKMYSGWPSTKTYASQYYPGPKRFSEAETQAVLAAMDSCSDIKAVINYHSMGRVIYWGYHSKKYKADCWFFVKLFKDMTGYSTIDESYTKATYGDFEHYVMHEYKVPYVCIENGKNTVPVPHSEFSSIYSKNKLGFAKAAYHFYQ